MKETFSNVLSQGAFKQCTICAYQESGHILFAYLCGYRCQHAELMENAEEEFSSISVFDYGKDSSIANKFLGHQTLFFTNLSLAEKLACLEVARKLSLLFLGGSVVVAVYNNKENVHIPLPMQIELTDLLQVEFIDQVIETLDPDGDRNFIENRLQDALYTVGNINIWETIVDLSERLLKHGQLNQNDIEECLEDHGIIYNEASPLQTPMDV